jgi:hypothetical protein
MVYHVTHLRWLESWREQLHSLRGPENFGVVHRWLWSSWKYRGQAIASDLNEGLGLQGSHPIQPDTPVLCVGQIDAPQVLFVHMHPGWETMSDRREEPIVRISDGVALNFYRAFFTRYPDEVNAMPAWNQAIDLGWRMTYGKTPKGIPVDVKRHWANGNLAGWALLPLRASASHFLDRLKDTPTGAAVEAAMGSSLQAALRLGAQTTLVASRHGAVFVNGLAQQWGWSELDVGEAGLPQGTTVYEVADRLVLVTPQPLGGARSLRLDLLAEAIGELHASRCGHGRRKTRRCVA